MHLGLISQRKAQIEERKNAWELMIQDRINVLKQEATQLRQIERAMHKRQRRIEEMREYIAEVKEKNRLLEAQKQSYLESIASKNIEFRILSGMDVL